MIIYTENSNLPHFTSTAQTMNQYINGIHNSFKTPYTNSYTGGINNKIKVLRDNAYEYRNFQRFRSKILLMCNKNRSDRLLKFLLTAYK